MPEQIDESSGIAYQSDANGLTTTRQTPAPENPAPVVSGDVDLNTFAKPVTVQYPSGHTVQFPSEAHAEKHAASVWDQLKDEWTKVKDWKGLAPELGPSKDEFGQSVIDMVKNWHAKAGQVLDEAGASLGRVPSEVLSGVQNAQAYLPSPYGQKPSIESVEDAAKREHPVLSGVGEGGGRFVGSMLAPENVAIMAAMPYAKAVPLLSKGLSVAFAAGMSKGVVDKATAIVAGWPKMTPQQRISALTEGSLQTVMAGLATIHAVSGEKAQIPSQLRNESGEMTIPGTGRVGSAEAAAKDTQYFKEAKEENPDASFSDWARIAQEKKAAAKSPMTEVRENRDKANALRTQAGSIRRGPKRTSLVEQADVLNRQADQLEATYKENLMAPFVPTLSPTERQAALEAPDVNDKGQKLGVKPIEAAGSAPIIDKTGHPDYNDKGQFLGIWPDVEDVGSKVRAEQPPLARGGVLRRLLEDESGEMAIPGTGKVSSSNMMDEDETPGPVWFSNAEDTIAKKVPNNASGDAIRSTLINNGVKPDEMKWSGLDEYLQGKPKVSKSELQDFIAQNKLKIEDVNYGGLDEDLMALKDQHQKLANLQDLAMQTVDRAFGNFQSPVPLRTFLTGTPGEQAEWLSKMSPEAAAAARQYSGIEEQRSAVAEKMSGFKLVVNPEESHRAGGTIYDVIDPRNGLVKGTGDRHFVNEYMQEHSEKLGRQVAPQYDKWTVPGEKTKYTEKLLTLPQDRKAFDPAKKAYDEFGAAMRQKYGDDILGAMTSAEVRQRHELLSAMDEARLADKSKNYTAPHFQREPTPNIVAHVRYSERPAVDGKKTLFLEEAQSDWHTDIRHKGYTGEYGQNAQRIKELQAKNLSTFKGDAVDQPLTPEEHSELKKLILRNSDIFSNGTDNVPNAPFHQNWHELAMKRMLREAAEKGYDRLAWTTGKQQADLYSLSRHIKSVEYDPEAKELVVHEHNGKTHQESVEPTVRDLTPYLGRELAEKMVDQIDNYDPGLSDDQLYEDVANRYSVDTEEQEPEYVVMQDGDAHEYFESERQAEKYIEKWWEENHPYHDPETGEWIPPEEGEERENDDNHDDIEPLTIETQEREPEYVIRNDGEHVEGGFDSYREAERHMLGLIDREVESERENYQRELPHLDGLDLQQGGEFHKLLYDTMIPSFLKKYGKKWGAEVKDVEMKNMAAGKNIYEGPALSLRDLDEKGADLEPLLSMREAERLYEIKDLMRRQSFSFQDAMNKVAERGPKGIHDLAERFGGKIVVHPQHEKVHSIEITPQLRRSVLKGQPIAKKENVPSVNQNA